MGRHSHGEAAVGGALAPCIDRPGFDYRGLDELWRAWSALPGARTRQFGTSVAGEPLRAFEIGSRRTGKVSLLIAGIHPMEWIAAEAALAAATRIAAAPAIDRRLLAVPIVNIDGYRAVEADLRAGRRRLVRGNRNRVDLNRNWPTHFRRRRIEALPFGRRGPHPLSEPEVHSVVDLLDEVAERAHIDVALSLHSIGQVVLYPYGGRWRAPKSARRQRRAARALARRLPGYRVHQCSRWIPGAFAPGMEIDHLADRYGATALLVECTRGGASIWRPRSLLDPFRIFNPVSAQGHAARLGVALAPFLRGQLG